MNYLSPLFTEWKILLLLIAILLILFSLFPISHLRVGTFEIDRDIRKNRDKRNHIELIIVSGFQEFLADANGILKEFLEELEKYHIQWFIGLLKEQGKDHKNIRNHIEVIRYEDILGLALRKVVIPRFFTIFFRNHIPLKKELHHSDSTISEKVLQWYRDKHHETFDMSQLFIAKNWPVGELSHGEFLHYCNKYLDITIFPELIDMFETVRMKRENIIAQIIEEVPELNHTIVSKRWKELYTIMGYNDILRG